VLGNTAAVHPDAEALVFDDPLAGEATLRWSYARLAAESRRVARALVACNVGSGARVGILLGNRPEAVATVFASAMVGAVAVPLSTFSTPSELEWLLDHAGVSLLVTQARLLKREFPSDIASMEPPPAELRRVVVVGTESWEAFLAKGDGVDAAALDTASAQVAPHHPAVIIYTSGTTERPKGILHSHGAIALQFWHQAALFRRRPGTRLWTALPMFWTAGFNTVMGGTLAGGACWVMQETFDPAAAIELMERERVTEPYTLPHQTAALEEEPGWSRADFSSMSCVFGKSAFARHPRVRGDTRWSMPVGYGLSETASFFSAHGWDAPRELRKQSMGRLLAGNELKVVDPDTGDPLSVGEEGELAVRGPTLMEHYVNQAPSECFDSEGFFHTGDAGSYDAEGYLHWSGRRTEMIKTAGANVSPAELEVELRACPPVKLARALGVPDDRRGERVVLCVVLKEGATATEAEIREFLAGRVASYKVPSQVLFVDEEDMPMTATRTKVRDEELRTLVRRRLEETSR
jgi:fatty-acyl-CoA synthase